MRELSPDGVTNAHWFWPDNDAPMMWLVTTTDAEKSRVLEDARCAMLVRVALATAGVPLGVANRTQVTVESIETLDRDYGGSWAPLLR